MLFLKALLARLLPQPDAAPEPKAHPFDRHLSMIENARPAPRQALFRNRRRPAEA